MPLILDDIRKDRESVPITSDFPAAPPQTSVPGFEEACRHYPITDFPLFCSAYAELCRVDLTGKTAVELACGRGDLAVCVAKKFPAGRIVAVDRYPESGAAIREAHARGDVPNLEYHCGDAQDLTFLGEASVDLVFGQAALHHLANDVLTLSLQTSRVIKPGGRLLFLFEPLGHNWLVSCIRAIQVARHEMTDESNLFFSTFREIGRTFDRVHVQSFNLSGYFLKGIPSPLAAPLARLANHLDRSIAAVRPNATKFGANANIVFYR